MRNPHLDVTTGFGQHDLQMWLMTNRRYLVCTCGEEVEVPALAVLSERFPGEIIVAFLRDHCRKENERERVWAEYEQEVRMASMGGA